MSNRTSEELQRLNLEEITINGHRAKLVESYYDSPDDVVQGNDSNPIKNKRLLHSGDFIAALNTQVRNTIGDNKSKILPMNCRFHKKFDKKYHLYVIEHQPEIRTITLDLDQSNFIAMLKASGQWEEFGYKGMDEPNMPYSMPPYKFNLVFPFCVFVIIMNIIDGISTTMGIFLRNMPIRGFGDMLFKAPLYNIPSEQDMCLGRGKPSIKGDIVLAIEDTINYFWNSPYNGDFVDNVSAYQEIPIVNNYFTWQYYTKKEPMKVYQIEWIPYKTIKSHIDKLEQEYKRGLRHNATNNVFNSFNDFTLLFSNEREISKESDQDEEEIQKFVDNIANYIYLPSSGFQLYIEDSFSIKNNRYLVLSFLTKNSDLFAPEYVKVMREKDKKIFIYKLSMKMYELIEKSIEEDQFVLSAEVNGFKLTKGDILRIRLPNGIERYRKIDHMRYNIDGQLEARLQDDYYILNNIEILEVVDLGIPKLYGEEINKNKKYIALNTTHRNGQLIMYHDVAYRSTDITRMGQIIHLFEIMDGPYAGRLLEIKMDDDYISTGIHKINNPENLRRIPYIHRSGAKMLEISNGGYPAEVYSIDDTFSLRPTSSEKSTSTLEEIINHTFYLDKSTFYLEGIDGDIMFSKGDKVIVPNWSEPLEMLKIKTIKEFKISEYGDNYRAIAAKVETKSGEEAEVPLVIAQRGYRNVNVVNLAGMYRITNKYKELSAGMKITANEARIANFPMKDTNIIIGFLIDMGLTEPLVICSNGCTLWYDDIIEKFNIIPYGSKQWDKKQHAPLDASKIRPQPGDLWVKRYDKFDPFVISYEKLCGNGLRYSYYNTISGSMFNTHVFDTYDRQDSIPYGILGPRYTQSQLIDMERISGYATPFCIFIYNQRSDLEFPVDPRRVQGYVQRLSE